MEIVEWYLEQATAAIEGPLEKRRVREELREHLGEIHCYDTQAGFSRMIGVLWIGVINAAIGFIGMVRSGFEEIKVTISLPPVFLPIILFLFIAGIWCLVQIWKIKRALQSETEIGIEPFRGRDFLVPALAWLAVVLLPAVMSAVVSAL